MVIAVPMLMYESEYWTLNRSERRETETAEMRFYGLFLDTHLQTMYAIQHSMHYKYML
jgi:hypothetical protein